MAGLRISRAWDATLAVLKRDARLLAPVALAFMVVPATLYALAVPAPTPGQMPKSGIGGLLYVVLMIVALLGQMAIIRLAIGPVTSVGEAIRHALRRAPAVIGAGLIFALPVALVLTPILLPIMATPNRPPPLPSLLLVIASIVVLGVWIRLILATAAGVAEPIGPVAIIKRSWALTRGNFWKLLGSLIAFGIVAWIVILAVQWVIGAVLIVALGKPEPWSVAALLLALIGAITQTIASVVFAVLLARIYLDLAGAQPPVTVPNSGT